MNVGGSESALKLNSTCSTYSLNCCVNEIFFGISHVFAKVLKVEKIK